MPGCDLTRIGSLLMCLLLVQVIRLGVLRLTCILSTACMKGPSTRAFPQIEGKAPRKAVASIVASYASLRMLLDGLVLGYISTLLLQDWLPLIVISTVLL